MWAFFVMLSSPCIIMLLVLIGLRYRKARSSQALSQIEKLKKDPNIMNGDFTGLHGFESEFLAEIMRHLENSWLHEQQTVSLEDAYAAQQKKYHDEEEKDRILLLTKLTYPKAERHRNSPTIACFGTLKSALS